MKTVDVDFGMEREYVFSILTADISITDSILDLIDNSIDAARKHISRTTGKKSHALPDTYDGYRIDITVSRDHIEIVDNCFGIEEHLLTRKAFRLGARSNEDFSIGIYGVGLVRAFWKLANSGELITDTGDKAYRLRFSKQDVLKDDAPKIPAAVLASDGGPETRLVLGNLTESAAHFVSDEERLEFLKARISQVYGLCIRKKLKITVNEDPIPEFGPRLRADVEKMRGSYIYRTQDGVDVEIQTGVHQDYLFSSELGHSAEHNRKLTDEFGWYVVCNDRIVLIADRSRKVGWTETWHSEYNGFLGWVFFKCADAEKLPWDSTKTDISLEKQSQIETAPRLKEYARLYRTTNRNSRKDDLVGKEPIETPVDTGNPLVTGGKRPPIENPQPSNKKGVSQTGRKKKVPPPKKKDHSKNLEQLLPSLHVATNNTRVIDLVDEGGRIVIRDFPYASAMLLRNLTESVINDFLQRSGGLKRCLDDHWAVIDDKRASLDTPKPPMNKAQRQDNRPSIKQTMEWLVKNGDEFPDTTRKANIRHLQNTMGIWSKLNEITHEMGTISDESKLKSYRNTILPLIEFLLSEAAIMGADGGR